MPSYHFPGAIDMNDTDARDEIDSMMNEITRMYFDFILVRCPACEVITARYDDNSYRCDNEGCSCKYRASDAPDLFF